MNRYFVFGILWALLTSCASRGPSSDHHWVYSKDIFIPINFIQNSSYLAMNVNFAPIDQLRSEIDAQYKLNLKNRGEAHITVLSPLEVEILKSKISIESLHQIARDQKIQESSFKPLCLGRGRMQIDGREESTYFIVVESSDLLRLRENLRAAYVAAGGALNDFKAEIYYPHITLGFTRRDLHFEDGVIKDQSSCLAPLTTADTGS